MSDDKHPLADLETARAFLNNPNIKGSGKPRHLYPSDQQRLRPVLAMRSRLQSFELALQQIANFNSPDPDMSASDELALLIKTAADALRYANELGDDGLKQIMDQANLASYLTQENSVLHERVRKLEIALAKEREACAKVAEEYGIARYHYEAEGKGGKQDAMTAAKVIATLIRGRAL